MSDDSGFLNENSPSKQKLENGFLDDLYKYISPPLPLFPKNKYTDGNPKSHLRLCNLRNLSGIENECLQGSATELINFTKQSSVSLISICENKNIVYKREDCEPCGPNLLDISNYLKNNNTKEKPFECIDSYYKPTIEDNTLIFESRFESGNLALASKVSETEYNLLMQNDINTKGHTQWFYFQVCSPRASAIKFNVLNFSKTDSLYNQGMKILVYSEKENSVSNRGWHREGEEISYYSNNIKKPNSSKTYFTLSFTYAFLYPNDKVYFAYSYPYTYSSLMEDLKSIENLNFLTRKLLCYSIGGNRCDYLTITAPSTPEEIKKRKGVVFTARVHPGETVGSWMMKGILNFLTGQTKEACLLRELYVFKIIPMLNPDGVINGNYRCGLAGTDLNRRWKNPSVNLHPTIYSSKKLIKSFAKERNVEIICDFHGHSRRKNIFAYGCDVDNSPQLTRAFPYLLSKVFPFFSYEFSSFRMQKSKQGTMRIALFKETKIPMIYTIEASFCGPEKDGLEKNHFTTQHLQEMGKQLCLSLLIYNGTSIPKAVEVPNIEEVYKEFESNKELLINNNENSSGSDSDPSDDNLDSLELRKLICSTPTTKKKSKNRSIMLVKSESKRKMIRSKSKRKTEPVTKVVIKKPLNKFCKDCKILMISGHVCQNLPVKSSFKQVFNIKCVSAPYYNFAGKKVRDQATQTARDVYYSDIKDKSCEIKDKNNEVKSDRSTNLSTTSLNDYEKGIDRSLFGKSKYVLPNVCKNVKSIIFQGYNENNRKRLQF